MKIKITKCKKRIQLIRYVRDVTDSNLETAKNLVDNLDVTPIIVNADERDRYQLQDICEFEEEAEHLFHVTYTKVITVTELINENQIQSLLNDDLVKSININK